MDQYAVIGNPVQHSLSPQIHSEFAKQTKQQLAYSKIEAPLDEFAKTVKAFQLQGGKGCNVTVPFKIEAFQLADHASDCAKQAGAANTLLFKEDGSIYADSTDGIGITQDLTNNNEYSIRQKLILLLGAGGAARAVIGPLLEQAPAKIIIANRTKSKAMELVERFRETGIVKGVGLDEFTGEPFDLIINATSAGLSDIDLNLPNSLITPSTCCYDMVYGKLTQFLQWAESNNACLCLDGLGMLVEQAAASFYVWRGVYPDTKPVIQKLRQQLEQKV